MNLHHHHYVWRELHIDLPHALEDCPDKRDVTDWVARQAGHRRYAHGDCQNMFYRYKACQFCGQVLF